jgi:hypothetical protein
MGRPVRRRHAGPARLDVKLPDGDGVRGSDLVGAVRSVAAGQSMLDPQAASQLMARLRDRTAKADPLAALTG